MPRLCKMPAMQIPGMSLAAVPLPRLFSAAARNPAPAPPVAHDVFSMSAPATPAIDLSRVFEKTVRTPVPPETVACWTHLAEDHSSIDETVRLADGTSMIIERSFDTSDNKNPRGRVICFNPDGTARWTFIPPQTSYSRDRIESHLLLGDGSSYAVTRGDGAWDSTHLIALDRDGHERWRWETEAREKIDSVRPTSDGGLVVKAGDTVVGLDKDGKERWDCDLPMHSDAYFHVVADDGTHIFVNDDFSNNFGYDHFQGISPKGASRELDLPGITSFPLQLDNRLVYAGADGQLHGVELGGKYSHWDVQTSSERGLKTPYAGADANIYVEGRFDSNVYCVSRDGTLRWQREITDAAPRGGLEDMLRAAPDGTAYYLREGGDVIARIQPDGKPGKDVAVSEGVSSFQVGPDGKLYIWSSESSIIVHDPEKSQSVAYPLEIEHPHVWDIKEVLQDGRIVFEGQGRVHHIRIDENAEIAKRLEEIISSPAPSQPPPTIEREQDWVVIGGVRVPVRRG